MFKQLIAVSVILEAVAALIILGFVFTHPQFTLPGGQADSAYVGTDI